MNKTRTSLIGLLVILLAMLGVTIAAEMASGTDSKPWICHPVNGQGETGNGWNLIDPSHSSSHIDEALYPGGHYWKHQAKDGRHDIYTDGQTCPGSAPEFTAYEVDVCWTETNVDGNVATYHWPQNRRRGSRAPHRAGELHDGVPRWASPRGGVLRDLRTHRMVGDAALLQTRTDLHDPLLRTDGHLPQTSEVAGPQVPGVDPRTTDSERRE